jgi:hypothetical protein
MIVMRDRELLVEQFVASFDKLDDMLAIEDINPIDWELSPGEPDEHGWKYWRPAKVRTERSVLDSVYSELTATFPPLLELLVLSCRWAEVDLEIFTLPANPPGPNLDGLLIHMFGGCSEFLLSHGYVQFAKGPDANYDPVCLDISSRNQNGDYKMLKFDHEEILCYDRLKIVEELAPSFEDLVKSVIKLADSKAGN